MIINIFGIDINWPSQILGLIGCAFCIYSFFLNKKSKFLLFCSIGYCFNAGEAALLLLTGSNTVANIIATIIAIIRNALLFYFLEKKHKETPVYFAVIFTIIIWLASIPFYNEWYTYIPPIAMTVATITLFFKNFIVAKVGNIVFEMMYLVYGIVVGAYSGIIRDGFGLISTIVSVILYIVYMKKEKVTKESK